MENEIFGVMHSHPEKKEVLVTPRNSVFFQETLHDGTPVMVYQGTGLIASMLEGMSDCQKLTGNAAICALFDTDGNFFENARLKNLQVRKNGSNKHTAYFEIDGEHIEKPADDIYCLGGTAVADHVEPIEPLQQQAEVIPLRPEFA